MTGKDVSYRFNDGSQPYDETRTFKTETAAQRFAARFAAEMRRSYDQNAVPLMGLFRNF